MAAAVVAGGCQASTRPSVPLPAGAPEVTVTMSEYRFDYVPPTQAGRVVFRVVNAGREAHVLSISAVPDDLPPIDAWLRGPVGGSITRVAEIPPQDPGQRKVFAVDLKPGTRYAFLCSLRTVDRELHTLKGMSSEFRAPATG